MRILKIFIVYFTMCMCFFSFALAADKIPVNMLNDTDKVKIARLRWMNHPFGCQSTRWGLHCTYDKAVGEIQPNAVFSVDTNTVGNIWCVIWENSNPTTNGEFNSMQCFEIEDEITIKEITITPNSIHIKN